MLDTGLVQHTVHDVKNLVESRITDVIADIRPTVVGDELGICRLVPPLRVVEIAVCRVAVIEVIALADEEQLAVPPVLAPIVVAHAWNEVGKSHENALGHRAAESDVVESVCCHNFYSI